ncbi:MAG: pyridoxal-phosphate dependent enzyme [Acidimicrobiia bacterium]|nr:pyridoxal-phosphate dependent enzyme [Acidimicrobiia bacterium]
MDLPTIDDVLAAADRIEPYVHRTPVFTSATLDRELESSVFFKCENLQKVGAFKARGATNAVVALSDDEAARGVATHSSGNHGQALAYAASVRGIPAWVVMPDHAPAVKVEAVRGYGAEVVFCKQAEREERTQALIAETGANLIHPYDNALVIAGQGTAALELINDVPDLEFVVAPVGGGGLLGGTTVVARAIDRRLKVVGGEPEAVDDAFRSIRDGVRHSAVANPQTLADGLLTGLGERNFALLNGNVEIVIVDEDEIVEAARFFLERMKMVVEPSGAVSLAAARKMNIAGSRVGVIVSGGNTDFRWLSR